MNIVLFILILFLLFIYIFFIRDLKEGFFLMSPRYYPLYGFGIPTRSTRLMSYDLRGDPFAYYIYPSYYSWGAPFNAYLYSPARYDITGKYLIPLPKNIKKRDAKVIKKLGAKIKPKQ